MDAPSPRLPAATGKRRVPKACGSCRQSKVRCDGKRPCTRCQNLRKTCVFVERPLNPHEQKIATLEKELHCLKQRIDEQVSTPLPAPPDGSRIDRASQQGSSYDSTNPQMEQLQDTAQIFLSPQSATPSFQAEYSIPHPSTQVLTRKRTRSQFEVDTGPIPNFLSAGLVDLEQARLYFDSFFEGCDRYVPIFDPLYDTFESIHSRSSLLFNTIITVGCGVLGSTDNTTCHMLNLHLKKLLNLVIVTPEYASLETVQALLVTACYVSERSLILAFTTRMALDLNLAEAFTELTTILVGKEHHINTSHKSYDNERRASLMRRARSWFQLLISEQILHVDAGNLRGFRFKGEPRRCRVLLDQQFSTILDLRLLSQVELNFLRARIHDSVSTSEIFADDDILDMVHDAQVDIDVWYRDWHHIMSRTTDPEMPVLLLNLEIQKYWSLTMMLCNSVRKIGNENIASMSTAQQEILLMAKDALKKHLRIIIDQPQHYLANFRYAMDFVWAKCAFCFLLLLKLTRLLPAEDEMSSRRLLQDGHILLNELNKVGGGFTSGGRSQTSKMYLQVLQLSIQKYGRALQDDQNPPGLGVQSGHGQNPHSPVEFFWANRNGSAQYDLESFVPEQFVFEWDFPGLTLFSSPINQDNFFGDLFADGFGGLGPFLAGNAA